jgi:hypothetical protein
MFLVKKMFVLPRFRGNEVRLWLSIVACNLGTLWCRLTLPGAIDDWVTPQTATARGEDGRAISET